MRQVLGAHIVKSAYGQWLPGDARGHWSSDYDPKFGYTQPHHLHTGDPARERMAAELLKHPPVTWSPEMAAVLADTLHRCAAESDWAIAALAIEPTHLHLLVTASTRKLDGTCKWLSQQMTRAVHDHTAHQGPVFAKGKWLSYIDDDGQWENTIEYINRHPGVH